MKRRKFIALLGGAAAAPSALWPRAARAQRPAVPVIGYLPGGAPEPSAHLVAAFRQGLREASYIEGQNLTIDYRWTNNQQEQLGPFAADLIRRRVSVIATPFSAAAALAAKAATATIPIVFAVGSDPVQSGLVKSISRPGGNATGVYYFTNALGDKRLGLVREMVPGAPLVAMLVNPDNPSAESTTRDVQTAASAIGQRIRILYARNNGEIDAAFALLVQERASALLVSPDPLFTNRRVQLATLAARYAVPAIYTSREYVEVGGLMSYGTSLADVARQVGAYAARILKGEKPADLPVVQPTKFELVVNLQTAKTLGLIIPVTLLALADEVIE